MNPAVEKAIKNVDRLFALFPGAESWSENLIKASRELKDPADWTLFYAYITDPTNFDSTKKYSTIGHKFDSMQMDPYPKNFTVDEYNNGVHDTIIHVRNMNLYDVDDEKNPV